MDKKIVLAIDDDLTQLKLYQEMLGSQYDFRAVKSASEALAFLNSNVANIILLDITMPNINGFEFLGDIRRIPSYMGVPILIVSGNNDSEFHRKVKNSTAAGVLIKPVLPETLIQAIEKALE